MGFPEDTTHFRHWVIQEDELKEQRKQVLETAIERLTQQLQEKDVCVSPSLFLSDEDCNSLVSYFVTQLLFVCSEKHFDYRVTNTAATFLIRFYLRRSVLEYDPRRILLTCILLAVKCEDLSMQTTLHHFCEGLISEKGIHLADVIDAELLVLDALSFHLLVLQPRPPIHFLTTEYYQQFKPPKPSSTSTPQELQAWKEADSAFGKLLSAVNRDAEQLALQSLASPDIPFLFTPSQIGIACFQHVAEGKLVKVEHFISKLFGEKNERANLYSALRPKLADLRARLVLLTEESQQEDSDEIRLKASKIIKRIDKLTKLIKANGSSKKDRSIKRQKKTSAIQKEENNKCLEESSLMIE